MTEEEWQRHLVDQMNSEPGTKDDGIDCPDCLNRGYYFRYDEQMAARVQVPCHCLARREARRRLDRSGLGQTLRRMTFATYQADDEWQRRIYAAAKARHEKILKSLDYQYDITELEKQWFEAVKYLRRFHIIDSEYFVNDCLSQNKSILAEGAQGTLLDVDFGSYPFVTSSNTVCAGVCTGLGIAPNRIGEVFGIFKAYCTRVGSGPFPTELFDETGDRLCTIGHEFGAVTGRKRRCGWLDMVALKYSIMINGVTQLIMMKSDVMNDFETIKVATAYEIGGRSTSEFPYEITDDLKPVYTEFEGWKCDLRQFSRYEEFPEAFKRYVEFIERQTGVPVKIISVGPDRGETIVR